MPTNRHDNPPRRNVYVVREVDFQQHAEIRIDLTQTVYEPTSRREVILVDSLGTHYKLPGLGRDRASAYGFTYIHDGLLALKLLNGRGEHYPEVLIRVVNTGSQPSGIPDKQLSIFKIIAE